MDELAAKIRAVLDSRGMLIDPHTAVGLVALDKMRRSGDLTGPAICLATAHPAKFPDAVEEASGVRPELQARYADLMTREERMAEAPADANSIRAVILRSSRFG